MIGRALIDRALIGQPIKNEKTLLRNGKDYIVLLVLIILLKHMTRKNPILVL